MPVTLKFILDMLGVTDEKQKYQGAICLFKFSNGGDLKKEFGKPWYRWSLDLQ